MPSYNFSGGDYDRAHFGDTIYQFYSDGQLFDDEYQFDDYIERARAELIEQSARYVPLDLDPMVVTVDHELRVVEQSQTPLVEAFIRNRHMVLLGGAGAGKTSSLRHLVCRGDGDLRILVELARFRRMANTSDLNALLMLVGEQVMALGKKTSAPSVRLLRHLLEKEPLTLLFDGLNEVEASIRPVCLKAIDDLRAQFGCRIVLSTRRHGFDPPPGWSIFRLRELTDSQVIEYLRCNAEPRVAGIITRQLAVDDNPLLRVPLFLKYVIDLIGEDTADDASTLAGSRATIVSRYVRFLSRRDDAKLNAMPIDGDLLRDVLSRLALKLQNVGQSLSRREAATLVADSFDNAASANEAFDRIAARGFLIVDDRHIRFWHHTIQEYFYANGRRDELFRGRKFDHRKARELFSRLADEDALTFAISEAEDADVEAMMRVGIKANPMLAIRWADDLAAAGRAGSAVDALIKAVGTTLQRVSRYSQLSYDRNPASQAVLASFMLLMLVAIVVLGLQDGFGAGLIVMTLFAGGLFFQLLGMLLTYPGCEVAATLAGATRGVRHRGVRERLTDAFEAMRCSPLSRTELVMIAESTIAARSSSDDPLMVVEHSAAPYVAMILGSSNDPRAADALEALVRSGHGNAYSIQALRTLAYRGKRYSADAERAERLARKLLANTRLPAAAHVRVAQSVKAIAPAIGRPRSAIRTFVRGFLLSAMWIAIELAWLLSLSLLGNWVTDGMLVSMFLSFAIAPIACAAVFYFHARSIGARRILGLTATESASPLGFALIGGALTFSTCVVIAPAIYLGLVPLIRLNARGPAFAIARAIFEQLESEEGADTQ